MTTSPLTKVNHRPDSNDHVHHRDTRTTDRIESHPYVCRISPKFLNEVYCVA